MICISWHNTTKPLEEGVLGVRNFKEFNRALLMKLAFNFLAKKDEKQISKQRWSLKAQRTTSIWKVSSPAYRTLSLVFNGSNVLSLFQALGLDDSVFKGCTNASLILTDVLTCPLILQTISTAGLSTHGMVI